ncbi:MAG: insulinase family protein [Candidatus Kapabacteria bacterium]|nr:insulinase family protein [Candidatus Kapabacteria bacterium]
MHKQPPLSTAPLQFSFPVASKATLANGTTVYLLPRSTERLITISVGIHTGALFDVVEGETTMTANMLSRGTMRLNPEAFALEVERRGCSISSHADRDSTMVTATGLADHTEALVGLLAECLLQPAFDEAELQRQLKRRLADVHVNLTDPDWLASHAHLAVAFPNHGYSRPREGTPHSIAEISRDTLVRVHQRFLAAPKDVIVAGSFDADAIVAQLDSALAAMPGGGATAPYPWAVPTMRAACLAERHDAVQTVIRGGLPSVGYDHADYVALSLCTAILGGYTLARLFMVLREQKGYTYGAYALSDVRPHASSIVFQTSVGNAVTHDALATLATEINGLAAQPITTRELDYTRQYMLGTFVRSTETPQQVASMVWNQVRYALPERYYETYVQRLQQLALEDLHDVASRYFSTERWFLGLCGAPDVVRPALTGLVDHVLTWDAESMSVA